MTKFAASWFKRLACLYGGIVLALVLSFSWLLFTSQGLSFVIWGAVKFVPQLGVASHSGALFPRFTLQGVVYKDDTLKVEANVGALTIAMRPSCLLQPRVCVDEMMIERVTLTIAETSEDIAATEGAPSDNTMLTSPIPIVVKHLVLSDVDADVLGYQVRWKTLRTGLKFEGNHLRISPTVLDSSRVALASERQSNVKASSVSTPDREVNPRLLSDIRLPLALELMRLDVNNFQLVQDKPIVVNHFGLEAMASESTVNIKAVTFDLPEIQGQLNARLTLKDDYPVELDLAAQIKQAPMNGQTIHLKAFGSLENVDLQARLGGLFKASIDAELKPLDVNFPFALTVTDGDVQWPLQGPADYVAEVSQFRAQGSLEGYTLQLESTLQGSNVPEIAMVLNGRGDLGQLVIDVQSIKTLGGEIRGSVMADWTSSVSWNGELSLDEIQPGQYWQQVDGTISGELKTEGSATEQGGWEVSVPKLDINGMLGGYPLNVEGTLTASDLTGDGAAKINTPELVVSHGPNHVTAKGEIAQSLTMQIAVNVPDLSKTVPQLQGKVTGDINLSGPPDTPMIALNLDGQSLKWQQDLSVASLLVEGKLSPLPLPSGKLKVQVVNAKYQDYLLDKLELNFDGAQQHKLTLDMSSNIVSAELALQGTLEDKPALTWKGGIDRMSLTSKQGTWRLNQPTQLAVNIDSQQLFVAAHCWLQSGASVCLEQDANIGKSGQVQVSVSQVDVAQLKMFLPQTLELKGRLNIETTAKWSPDSAPDISAIIDMDKGTIKQLSPNPLQLSWDALKLNASLNKNELNAKWLFNVTDNGDVSGHLHIADILVSDKIIDANVSLSRFNLDFLAPAIGDYSQLKSNISTDLTVVGPMTQPKVKGDITVEDMVVKGEMTPIEIDSGRLMLKFTGYDATLNGDIGTSDGKLELAGMADWNDMNHWHSKLRVFAEQLMIDVPPMIKLKVIPDMTIVASPKQANIDGKISLPWGRIVVEALPPSAISVSKDQVLLNRQLKPEVAKKPFPLSIETNINIDIGDDVKLSAFGLESGLSGNLNVAQRDQGPFVTGEVNLIDGSYRSFGQDLMIKQGKVLMNGPVDQPYVQITAVRNPDNTKDDVTAGVRVTGPADEPEVTLFSDPAMPQANALSYLLRGQNIDGESGGNTMTATLIGLSLAKSGRVVGEIGEAFGVQDFQVDTAGSGDDSQVTVSGYVLPGLQVKYGVGIFDSVGEFTVRYRLMQDLYVEAVSGLDSAVDLLYQFEFN
ncbi:translocation/assembly module TamB domain-containing protein [Vibrio ostreicida]|uniref:autotransporter assembly complex protein TamB n=1 Tax=Vibrio ostreicida TaxID=526588 RepID=UPI003B58CB0A